MRVTIKRFRDGKYREEIFTVEPKEGWTVLDVLFYIKENLDETLSYRVMCRSSVCGTCAVKVNGNHVLACKEHVSRFGDYLLIEPVDNLKPLKDLVVDHAIVVDRLRAGKVWFEERNYRDVDSPGGFNRIERQWDCIGCLICESVCPVFSQRFGGPFLFTKMYRTVEDPRNSDPSSKYGVIANLNITDCTHCNYCSIYCPKSCQPELVIRILEAKLRKEGLIEEKRDNLDFLSF